MIANTHVSWFALKLLSYGNPTANLRQRSLLQFRVKMKKILDGHWIPENTQNHP